ncbi:MAG: hypothetical protein AAF702_01550 [Chloroflexota bacterium]
MKTEFRKIRILLFFLAVLMLLTGCFMNRNAERAAIVLSDNRARTEQARIDANLEAKRLQMQAETAAAKAEAEAKIGVANEQTEQVFLIQNATSERLYSFQMFVLARSQENTTRLVVIVVAFLILFVLGGGAFFWVYLRNNPAPVPWGYLPAPQPEELRPIPYSMLLTDKARQAGWGVRHDADGYAYGQRTKADGTIQYCKLLEG